MLLAGRPPKTGSSSNPLLLLQPNRLPKFGKEKEPGVLHMQADTVMLNPGSTSENMIALIITVITVIMSLQMTWSRTRVITLSEFLRFFSSMYSHMILQMRRSRARVITLGACERFFSSMDSHMSFQRTWFRARVVTVSATVWFLTSVNSHMNLQMMWLSARVITLSTTIRLFSRMYSHVSL